ncbi:MAG TPA: 4Fe-4S dicluster domain-containing protein [Anaerolineae bacterium]
MRRARGPARDLPGRANVILLPVRARGSARRRFARRQCGVGNAGGRDVPSERLYRGHPIIVTTQFPRFDHWSNQIDTSAPGGRCVDPCPVNAIEVVAGESKRSKRGKVIKIDADACIGCGVCRLSCALDGIALVKRKQRVLTPEDTFERVILMSLERGTLQNQLFDDPSSLTQGALRGIVGAFLRLPPVKQKLMSDQMRSSFLDAMRSGARKQRKAVPFS